MRHFRNFTDECSKGFTLIEILTVVAILGLLLAVSVVSLANLRVVNNLSAAADMVKITLEKARLSSLSKEDGNGYSLKFNQSDIVLFKGGTYNPLDSGNKIIGLPAGIEISSISLTGGGSIVSFNNLSGTTTPGTIILTAVSNPDKTRIVYIDGSGRAFGDVPNTPGGGDGGGGGGQNNTAAGGLQDFDLGWSIRTTSELKFRFLTDPPETDIFITEPHFNGDRSVFNYVGIFEIGGIVQTIRIYSNHVTAGDTILSIMRDPADANLPLEISIDDRVIVTYFGDGTMTVGEFGGTVVEP